MIQYNKQYDLNNGQGWIVFKSVGSGIVSAEYNRGTIQGMWDGETLKGEFIDTVSKGQGLIEFQFNENGFNAKWKAGLDEGPMKGKWVGKLENSLSQNDTLFSGKGIEGYKRYLSYYLSKDEFNGENIPKEFITPLEKKYFQELLPDLDVISFELDNDERAKDKGGNWSYVIFYHIPSGSLLRNNFTLGEESFAEHFVDSKVILLSGYSIDMKSYRGLWNIKGVVPPTEDRWDISFWDTSLKNVWNPDVISDDIIERVKSVINANLIYEFVEDVIELLNSKK